MLLKRGFLKKESYHIAWLQILFSSVFEELLAREGVEAVGLGDLSLLDLEVGAGGLFVGGSLWWYAFKCHLC